jgi:hypothetical protein
MAAYPPPPPQQQQAVVEHGREPCPDRILGERRAAPARRAARVAAPPSATGRRPRGRGDGTPRQGAHAAPDAAAAASAAAATAPTRRLRRRAARADAPLAPTPSARPRRPRPPRPPRLRPALASDDIGGAFGMGALGGGLWHTYRGLKNSPKGYKIAGTLETLRRESPRIGGNFANWGLMFSVFDCSCMYVRQKVRARPAAAAGAGRGLGRAAAGPGGGGRVGEPWPRGRERPARWVRRFRARAAPAPACRRGRPAPAIRTAATRQHTPRGDTPPPRLHPHRRTPSTRSWRARSPAASCRSAPASSPRSAPPCLAASCWWVMRAAGGVAAARGCVYRHRPSCMTNAQALLVARTHVHAPTVPHNLPASATPPWRPTRRSSRAWASR